MKQGSTDDPFADDTEETQPDDAGEDETPDAGAEETTEQSGQPQRQSLPYIHARNGVKDGRTQRPVFLRSHVEEGIDDLVEQMESALGEDVYKTDVTEAAMVVAQQHPELVRETLESWGYGWE